VAGTRRTGRRGIARLLMVCAVLAGLFLMHGAPASAAEGCHGAMSAPTTMGGGTTAGMQPAGHGAMAHPGGVQAAAPSAMHGEVCVSTAARERAPLPGGGLLAVVAVLAAVFLVSRPAVRGRPGRGGRPPPGGRGLLLQVCIART
jgi:hypothetical protein